MVTIVGYTKIDRIRKLLKFILQEKSYLLILVFESLYIDHGVGPPAAS